VPKTKLGHKALRAPRSGYRVQRTAPRPKIGASFSNSRPDHGRGPFKCSIHPEWLRRLETLCAAAQSDIAQDCIVKAFQLMPRTQLLPPIGKDLVQPTPMRALNVMSADVHGCLQFPNIPLTASSIPEKSDVITSTILTFRVG
jgi:hypothetical protein